MPIPLLYGFLIGLAQLVATLVVFSLGLHGSAEGLARAQKPESIIGFVLLMLLLGLAHRAGKKASLARGEPEQALGAAAKLAGLTALVSGLSAGVFQWLYAALINPRLGELQRAQVLEQAGPDLAKLSPEAGAAALRQIEAYTSPVARGVVFGVNTLLFAALLGIAYALIFRAAVRRDQKAGAKSA